MTGGMGLLAAFAAGLVSSLTPCVLPLVPGYLSFLGGVGSHADAPPASARRPLILSSLLFVAGFSGVFVLLGASVSLLGGALVAYRSVLARAAGVIIIAFGVLMLGVVRVPWLYAEARFDPARARGHGVWSALLMGAAFGFGWSPCVGPVLGAILMLAARQADALHGVVLLGAYSAGLGAPFVLAALFLGHVAPVTRWLARRSQAISRVSGVVLIALGVAMSTGTLGDVTLLLHRIAPILPTG